MKSVAFRDLSVDGRISHSGRQGTVGTFLYDHGKRGLTWLSRRSSENVAILRDIEGVVQSGEMLLVLGRPGSGCSTFLKSMAGQLHGIEIKNPTWITYEGV